MKLVHCKLLGKDNDAGTMVIHMDKRIIKLYTYITLYKRYVNSRWIIDGSWKALWTHIIKGLFK